MPELKGPVWTRIDLEPEGGLYGNRWSASIDNYQASLYGLGEAAAGAGGMRGAEDWFRAQRESNETGAAAATRDARRQGAIDSYKDVRGVGDAVNYVGGLAVQSAPYMAEAVVGGLTGGLGFGATIGRNTARTAGAVIASYPSAVGDILSNQREQADKVDLLSAAALAVPYAGLNAVGVEGALARRSFVRNGVQALDEMGGLRGGLARGGVSAARGYAVEGATEVGQEMLNQYGRMQVDPSAQLFSPDATDRYMESFIGGGALGGVASGATGWRRSEGFQGKPTPGVADQPQNILQERPDFRLTADGAPLQQAAQFDSGWDRPDGVGPDQPTYQYPMFEANGAPTYGADTYSPMQRVADVREQLSQPAPLVTPEQLGVFSERDQIAGHLDEPAQGTVGQLRQQYAAQAGKAITEPSGRFVVLPENENEYQLDAGERAEQLAGVPLHEIVRRRQERQEIQGRTNELNATRSRAEAVGIKGNAGVELFTELEQLRAAGKLTEAEFKENVALVASRHLGAVRKFLKAKPEVEKALATAKEQFNASVPNVPGAVSGGSGAGVRADTGRSVADSGRVSGEPVRSDAAAGGDGAVGGQAAPVLAGGPTDVALAPKPTGPRRVRKADVEAKPVPSKPVSPPAAPAGPVFDNEPDFADWALSNHPAVQKEPKKGIAYLMSGGSTSGATQGIGQFAGETHSLRDIGKRLGVAGQTVKNWLDEIIPDIDSKRLMHLGSKPSQTTVEDLLEAAPQEKLAPGEDIAPDEASSRRDPTKTSDERELKLAVDEDIADETAASEREDDQQGVQVRDRKGAGGRVKSDSDEEIEVAQKLYKGKVTPEEEKAAASIWESLGASKKKPVPWSKLGPRNRLWFTETLRKGTPEEIQEAYENVSTAVNEGIAFSKDTRQSDERYTAEELEAELQEFMQVGDLGFRVHVVDTPEDLLDKDGLTDRQVIGAASTVNDPAAVAWAQDGSAFIIASRVRKGAGRAIFLHEVGSHLGLERILTKEQFQKLHDQIVEWVKSSNGIEGEIAERALDRVAEAGTSREQMKSELVAYFIEEAVKAGIDPTASAKLRGPIGQWFRTLWAAFKVALRRLGVSPDKMTATDVVNLAYGAARLQVNARWHGTPHKVGAFRTSKIGSGEGAQVYGWGLYFAERRGIAESYRDNLSGANTHERYYKINGVNNAAWAIQKSDTPDPAPYFRGVDYNLLRMDGADRGVKKAARDWAKWGGDIDRAIQESQQLTKKWFEQKKKAAAQGFDDLAKQADEQGWREHQVLRELKSFKAEGWKLVPYEGLNGNLYSTDHGVKDDEWLMWDTPDVKTLSKVRAELAFDKPHYREIEKKFNKWLSHHAGNSEVMGPARDENITGEEILKALEHALGSPKAASQFLDQVVGVKGVKYADGGSRNAVQRQQPPEIRFGNGQVLDSQDAYQLNKWGVTEGFGTRTLAKDWKAKLEAKKAEVRVILDKRDALDAAYREANAALSNMPSSREERDAAVARFEEAANARRKFVGSNMYDIASAKNDLAVIERVEANGGLKEIQKKGPKPTFNYVVFNDKNIVKATTNIQFSRDASLAHDNALERIFGRSTQAQKDAWTNVKDMFEKHAPWFLTNYQLAQQYGKKIASLAKYVGLQQQLTTERVKQAEVFHNIAVEWDKLVPTAKQQLNQLMQRATLKQIHPDLPFDHADNKHLTPQDRAEHIKLKAQYDALNPHAKKVYQDAKKALADQWAQRRAAYGELVKYTYGKRQLAAFERDDPEASVKLDKQATKAMRDYDEQMGRLKGPYFPLMRFGDYLAIAESGELKDAKEALKNAPADKREELEAKLDALRKDPKHYIVSAHETKADMLKAMRHYRDDLGFGAENVRTDMADQALDNLRSVSQDTLDHIQTAIEKNVGGDAAAKVNDALAKVFLQSLPEMHALKREAQRKGIEGASTDMLRAFAAAGQSGAFYTSRLMYASEMADTLFQMKQEVKGKTELQHIHREMEKRMALDMQYKSTPVQDTLSSISWAYHLGLSPSFMFINSTQPYLVTGPMLASKFGVTKASKALGSAARDALMVLKAARFKDGKFDPWSGISEESLKDFEDRKAIRKLMERGIVDEGAQHELNMFADDSSRFLAKVNRYQGWTTQQIELANRLTSALAAFRLARKGGDGVRPMDYEAAVQYAYDTTLATQMDYSQEGTARFMREGGGIPFAKLLFQFRRYQQGMLYLLVDNIKKSFGSGVEAKEARAAVGYFALTSALSAGAMGLPFISTGLLLANAFIDDDDEEGDAETRLRNWLYDLSGDRTVANVLAKGIPAAFGVDVSKRIGLGDLASVLPMARFDKRTGQENLGEAITSAVPALGVGARWIDAGMQFEAGNFAKGSEKLAPKWLSDPLRAGRYATQGMTDSKENEILGADEIGAWNIAMRALGFSSTQESNYYEATDAKRQVQTAMNERKTQIQTEFRKAMRSGDMAGVRSMISEYNADHPKDPIKPKDEMQWRKMANKNAAQRDESGVRLDPKRDRALEDVVRFAR